MSETYLIDDAAKYIGISRRNFERMNISSREEFREARDGKKRKVRVYDKEELDRIKAERESPSHKPSVSMTTGGNIATQFVTLSDFKVFAEILVEGIQKETQKLLVSGAEESHKKVLDLSSFKDKYILNFSQALQLSGLPSDELRNALNEKRILAKKTSEKGTWKINRESLEEFCRAYFE